VLTHSTQELPYFGHKTQKNLDKDPHGQYAIRHLGRDYNRYENDATLASASELTANA
jgi:hypothetical protein